MHFVFPTAELLQNIVLDGTLPVGDRRHAVRALAENGTFYVKPEQLSTKGSGALVKRGITTKKLTGDPGTLFISWLHLLPLERHQVPVFDANTPALVELPAARLGAVVAELRRLGGDPQAFRFVGDDRAIIQTLKPPVYTLLRGDDGLVTGFWEQAKGIWTQAGYRHPFASILPVPDDKIILLRHPDGWQEVESTPWHDARLSPLVLPETTGWKKAKKNIRLNVGLRLEPHEPPDTEPTELWLLPDLTTLTDLVSATDDKLLARLQFAYVTHAEQSAVLLRLTQSRLAAPELNLPKSALPYRAMHRLPNLFLPRSTTLYPPLRRDAVRNLFAADSTRLTWLVPAAGKTFTTGSIEFADFRSLTEWVEYTRPATAPRIGWQAPTMFDVEPFAVHDHGNCCEEDKPKEPKPRKEPKPVAPAPTKVTIAPAPKPKKDTVAPEPLPVITTVAPSALRVELNDLEKQFEAMAEPLDDPARKPLWLRMGAINAALDKPNDAAVCWLNAAWDGSEVDWAAWRKAEKATVLDYVLSIAEPLPHHLRQLATLVLTGVADTRAKLPQILAYLDKHDTRLGVRATWLVRQELARLAGDDVLALARGRDRVLERLVKFGLTPEYDLPAFLRFAGEPGGDRYRVVRDRVANLRNAATNWVQESYKGAAGDTTQAYKDLFFAFGLAKLGETTEAQRLTAAAKKALHGKDAIHTFLFGCYEFRVQQAMSGENHGSPLPKALQEQLAKMGDDAKKSNDARVAHYIVGRLRGDSRILEPHDKVDAYREWRKTTDALGENLEVLYTTADKEALEKHLTKLIADYPAKAESLRVLTAALHVGGNLTEGAAANVLNRLLARKRELTDGADPHTAEANAKLLERALFLAAHWDRGDMLQNLVAVFFDLLNHQQSGVFTEAVDGLAQCLRGLRKLGLRQEVDALLGRMTNLIMKDTSLAKLKEKSRNNDDWADTVRSLMPIAAGWLYFGKQETAMPFLNEARGLLFATDNKPATVKRSRLARAYADALGQAPVELGLERYQELFAKLGPLTDTFTTNSHFSLSQLQVVESVVRAVVSDDFAMGQNLRRWLDEDEYLVRRRIHADVRAAMTKAGV